MNANKAQQINFTNATLLFRWDWGPSFPSMGIYKKISLLILEEPKLQYAKFSPVLQANKWQIQIETIFDLPKNSPYQGTLEAKLVAKNGSIISQDIFEAEIIPIPDEGKVLKGLKFWSRLETVFKLL